MLGWCVIPICTWARSSVCLHDIGAPRVAMAQLRPRLVRRGRWMTCLTLRPSPAQHMPVCLTSGAWLNSDPHRRTTL